MNIRIAQVSDQVERCPREEMATIPAFSKTSCMT